jgi:hypothetical protein
VVIERVARISVRHHRTDRLGALHQLEALVDVFKLEPVRDEIVDVDPAVHVPVDDPGHIGAAARTAEGRPFPFATGDELERPGADLIVIRSSG